MRTMLCWLTVVLGFSIVAEAVPIGPGESVTFFEEDPFAEPTGELVASDTRTVTLTFVPPEGYTFVDKESVTRLVSITSRVLRDPSSEHLTFFYDIEQADVGADPGAEGALVHF